MRQLTSFRVDRSSQIPLHRQIKDAIKHDILNGILQPGDQLQSVRDLCGFYNVSQITILRAISDLADERMLSCVQGKGTFVLDPSAEVRKTHTLGVGLYESGYLCIPFFATIVAAMAEEAAPDYQVQIGGDQEVGRQRQ